MIMTIAQKKMGKPIQLRIIFILNALMMFLPFIFYYVFTTKDISIEGFKPNVHGIHRSGLHL